MKGKKTTARGSRMLTRVLTIALCACLATFGLSACRPTDFFTEVIISPFAEEVDEDNPEKTIVNSPDVEEESDELSALDWTEESEQSEEVENLVVYSSDPTTDMTTHHSIFDLYPLIPGIEASDGVRVVYDADAVEDNETEDVDEAEEEPEDAESTSTGGEDDVEDAEETADEDADDDSDPEDETDTSTNSDSISALSDSSDFNSDDAESSSDSDEAGGDAAGDSDDESSEEGGEQAGDSAGDGADSPSNSGDGEGDGSDGSADNSVGGSGSEDSDEGGSSSGDSSEGGSTGEDEGGSGGDTDVYEPGTSLGGTSLGVYDSSNAFSKVPRVNSLAVIGSDVAVLVQAIGGEGSICAMSEDAYYGTDDDTIASSFSEVFGEGGDLGDQDDFEENNILWSDDGTEPSDLSDEDLEALVEALEASDLGDGSVIIYDQDEGDQSTFFNDEQIEALYEADVTMVPVDLDTVGGILDASDVIGDALEDSSCANDSPTYAKAYRNAVKSIVSAVADLHGGSLAAVNNNGSTSYKENLLTEYNSCPVKTVSYVGGNGNYPIRSAIAIEASVGWSWTGDYTIDVSDVLLFGSSDYDDSPLAFWGQVAGVAPHESSGDGTDTDLFWPYGNQVSPVGKLSGDDGNYYSWLDGDSSYGYMNAGPTSINDGLYIQERYGLGSRYMPYLVVCGTEDFEAEELEELVEDSMGSYYYNKQTTAYSVFRYGEAVGSTDEGSNVPMNADGLRSTIGATNTETSESPFYTNLDIDSVVRSNPCGLLGSWTEGSMECVLEAIWLGELYSESPTGCDYDPINDFDEFSVTIADVECTSTRAAVKQFYSYFYRVSDADFNEYYDAAVPDQLEDL